MISSNIFLFLSTLSLRRATWQWYVRPVLIAISIHALLAESDAYGRINDISRLIFLSTLSLRRATIVDTLILADTMLFLSTLSLRRATRRWARSRRQPSANFYPRSPCGERHRCADLVGADRNISIHALLAESDASKAFCAMDFF